MGEGRSFLKNAAEIFHRIFRKGVDLDVIVDGLDHDP
jgi:hypothetical protein